MSSLWTPGGEHPVPPSGSGSAERRPGPAAGGDPSPAAPPPTVGPDGEELTPEQQAELAEAAEEMARFQQQLVQAPVEMVVANHVMGLYELAAIHLNRDAPDLDAARLAIDALGGALDACRGRLGEAEATLVDARSQLQMAFVRVTHWVREQGGAPPA